MENTAVVLLASLLLLAVAACIAAWYWWRGQNGPRTAGVVFAAVTGIALVVVALSWSRLAAAETLVVAGHEFNVTVAATATAREQGLMGRHALAPQKGMWFVFDEAAPRSFWMKNTPLRLDILFFDAGRRLVSMQLNVPPCRQARCPLYPSGQPAQYALEVAAGTARRLGLTVGDGAKLVDSGRRPR